MSELNFSKSYYENILENTLLYHEQGKVTRSIGVLLEAKLPSVQIGSVCELVPHEKTYLSHDSLEAEVVGFHEDRALLMPYEDFPGMTRHCHVILKKKMASFRVGDFLLGRVLDSRGCFIDQKASKIGWSQQTQERSLYQKPVSPLARKMIQEPLDLGVRSMNGLLTCGKGQRIGIMAGSGVGKSVLLGMIARNTKADVNVIALVGERGREVLEFIEKDLGPEGLKRSVMVVATSDQSALLRIRAAYLATTIAEYFRDQNKDVLLMMDSVTRFCMAQREIGLSMGEPPTTRGYTPSVFASIPKLLERAGMQNQSGSITGIYTVLVEGDDLDDPVADATRSILDGHIVLSRQLAQKNHFPAIDVLRSTSRVMRSIISSEHYLLAGKIRDWIAAYQEVEDLIHMGAYVPGSDQRTDQAIAVIDKINQFLKQEIEETSSMSESIAQLMPIVRLAEAQAELKQFEKNSSEEKRNQISKINF